MIILKNATLIDENANVRTRQDIVVEGGIIRRIVSSDSPQEDMAGENSPEKSAHLNNIRDDDEVIDCTDYVVTPGLVNLHAHTAMNIFKGIAEDVEADVWFNEMIWPYESRMTPEDIYTGTVLGIAEMIGNGVTAVADHYFGEEQVLKAALDTGIRMDIAPTVFGTAPDFKDRLSRVKEFIKAHSNDSDRVALRFGPHSNYTCPGSTLEEIVDTARSMSLPIHLHLSEEEPQVITSREKTGRTPFEVLHDAGGFQTGVLVAHGLWVEESDVPLLGEDTWFAFCPKTYMKLGYGRGGFFSNYDRLHFGFGTDGAASSNTVNIIEQARLFALLEKFERRDALVMDAAAVWKHLMEGHRALPFGSGRMQEGAPADLVIWDLWTPDTCAFYNPLSAILYSAGSANVRYTMVGGEFLKADGRLKLNVKELMQDLRLRQKELLGRGKGKAQVYYG